MRHWLVQPLPPSLYRAAVFAVGLVVAMTVTQPVRAEVQANGAGSPPGTLSVVATPVPDNIPEPGGEVSYTVEVAHISPGSSIQLVDIVYDIDNNGTEDVTYAASEICQNTFLSPPPDGNTTTCTFSRELTGNAGDRLTGKITVTGLDKQDRRVRSGDTATVTVTDFPAAIQVDKLVEPTILEVPGGPVSFVVTVTNISVVDDVSITAINDPDFGGDIREYCFNDPGGPAEVDFPAILAPGGAITCTTPGTVIGRDGERIVRSASAEGIDDDGNPFSDDGSATVIIQKKITSVGLGKFVMPEQMPEPGGPVKYLLEITNASAKDGVTINRVMYSTGGDLEARDCSPNLPAFLAPGEMAICTVVKTVEGNAGEVIENTATASGTNDAGQVGEVWIKTRVEMLDVPSSIQVVKSVSPSVVSERGGAVTFTVKVMNTSVVDTVTLEKIDDPGLGGDIREFCTATFPVEMKPGENFTCTIPHVIEPAGGQKKISSTASASGTDDDGNPVSDSDEAVVDIVDIPSSIVAKVAVSPTSVPETGGEVIFSVAVENTSPLDTVRMRSIVDSIFGDVSGSCRPELPADLDPGEIVNCSFREVVTGVAGKEHAGTITASGTDDDGSPVKASGDATVSFTQVLKIFQEKISPGPTGQDEDASSAAQADNHDSTSEQYGDTLEDTGSRICMGRITELSMVYHGPYSEQVMIKDKDSRVLFSEEVYPDEPFSFTGKDSENTCTSKIKIYVNWRYHTTIITDCSIDIGPGFRSGDFEVVRGRSSYGGPLGRVDK